MNLVPIESAVRFGEIIPPGSSARVIGTTHPLNAVSGARIDRYLGLTIEQMLQEALGDHATLRPQSSKGQFDLEHKFAVGQTVVLTLSSSWSAAVGDHVIQHLIPKSDADADNPRYRVKSIVDSQERIVPQNDLTLSERSFSRKLSVAR